MSVKKRRELKRTGVPGSTSYSDVLGPEQELSVQVGALYGVHVCDSDVSPLPSAQAHEGKVLQQLTANSTSSHLHRDTQRYRNTGV